MSLHYQPNLYFPNYPRSHLFDWYCWLEDLPIRMRLSQQPMNMLPTPTILNKSLVQASGRKSIALVAFDNVLSFRFYLVAITRIFSDWQRLLSPMVYPDVGQKLAMSVWHLGGLTAHEGAEIRFWLGPVTQHKATDLCSKLSGSGGLGGVAYPHENPRANGIHRPRTQTMADCRRTAGFRLGSHGLAQEQHYLSASQCSIRIGLPRCGIFIGNELAFVGISTCWLSSKRCSWLVPLKGVRLCILARSLPK
jgi:hypothetical protein